VNWACTKMTYQMKDQEESWFSSLFALFAKRKPQNKMFRKLFRYISGANDQKEKIPMTSPVFNVMKPRANNMMTKVMCFYLDKAHQANPPKPTDPTVTIKRTKNFKVYVHTFGGYVMKDSVNVRKAKEFLKMLNNAGMEVNTSQFYTAGYDSPMKWWNRRNEVMYLAAN